MTYPYASYIPGIPDSDTEAMRRLELYYAESAIYQDICDVYSDARKSGKSIARAWHNAALAIPRLLDEKNVFADIPITAFIWDDQDIQQSP